LEAFTGLESRYDVPAEPDLVLDTSRLSVDEAARALVAFVDERTRPLQTEDRHAATRA
jgi:adenylylsulfate kinase-like enzyme